MMRRLPPRQRFHSSFPQVPLNVAPFASNRGEVELVGTRSSNHHEIHPGRKQVRPKAKAFAADSLDAIALDGIAHLTPDHEPQTRWKQPRALGLRRNEQRKVRSHNAPTELLGSDELGVTAEPPIRPERKRHPPRRELL